LSAAIPIRFAFRVIDANSGAVIAANLPHLHQSSGSVHALQRGYPGSTTIGSFTILLAPPLTAEGAANKTLYFSLAVGQKVEGYLGDVVAGTPRVSGVITKITRYLSQPWTVECQDTLYWLQQSQVLPGETLAASTTSGLNIVQQYSGTQEVVWDDDFSGWNGSPHPNSSDYTLSGFSFTASDPNLGLPALTCGAAGLYALVTNGWNRDSQYSASSCSIHGTMQSGTNASFGGEASIFLLTDATAANGILVGVFARETGTPGLVCDARIYTLASGTYTLADQAANIFGPLGSSLLQFEVSAVIYAQPSSNFFLRLLVNGQDVGFNYLLGSQTSGRIGIRFSPGAGGGSPAIWVNRIQFHGRTGNLYGAGWGTNRFAAGAQSSNRSVYNAITGNGQTHLDMLLLASSLDGFWLRKNPGVGPKADSLDYAASPGKDLSTSVIFEEGVNIDASGTLVGPVAEIFSTDVKMNAIAGSDSGGQITWGTIGNAGDIVLTNTVVDLGTPGFSLLASYAETVQARASNPLQAVQVAVIRTADTADLWRELDFVTVHIPSLNVLHQRAQVVGWTWDESSTTQTVYLNEFPLSRLPQAGIQRVLRPLEWLTQP
jgi:hypothetical protein